MILIMFFNVIFGLTLRPVVWLYIPEIAPPKLVPSATAMCFTVLFNIHNGLTKYKIKIYMFYLKETKVICKADHIKFSLLLIKLIIYGAYLISHIRSNKNKLLEVFLIAYFIMDLI